MLNTTVNRAKSKSFSRALNIARNVAATIFFWESIPHVDNPVPKSASNKSGWA